ncbi:MAG: hypothetical protein J7623_22895 [Chitinophaga sp.]|uniref:hypothetical protein n=1 Tax=Chitinophaga sp. TaxID=1869181 RepID=UPI001B112993|nr:hypothetical protein [Chitinophaga sp.]MBO9731507.1 hypothetical protein [Chitinophaga sp.]
MRTTYLFVAIAFLEACTSAPNKSATETVKMADSTPAKREMLTYPYKAAYSSDFEIGDPKNAQTVLELYKNWDANTVDNSKSSFAETDTMYFSDGSMFAGNRDSLFAVANKMRGQMGTVVNSIHAWLPLRSKDKQENWVIIWTRETSTDAKGKTTAKELQETWRLDENGKINLLYQYTQLPPKMMASSPAKKK